MLSPHYSSTPLEKLTLPEQELGICHLETCQNASLTLFCERSEISASEISSGKLTEAPNTGAEEGGSPRFLGLFSTRLEVCTKLVR